MVFQYQYVVFSNYILSTKHFYLVCLSILHNMVINNLRCILSRNLFVILFCVCEMCYACMSCNCAVFSSYNILEKQRSSNACLGSVNLIIHFTSLKARL